MNKMFNFNIMPYNRSGRAGGKSVSMVGMLVLLLAASFFVTSCIDGDTDIVTETETVPVTVPGPTVTVPETVPVTVPETVPVTVPGPTMYICPDENATEVADRADCPPSPDELCEEGTAEADDLEGSSFDDYICGLAGDDTITAGGGNDTLEGGADNDTLRGGAGNDVIKGDAGDDKLYSGGGNDRLYGGEGSDELIVQGGDNMLDGGEDMDGQDMDIAIYLETGGVSANLARQTATHLAAVGSTDPFAAPGGGVDTLMNIENVKGSHMFDILIGDGEDNLLKGLDGPDHIAGGAGDDKIIPNRPMPPALNATEDGLAEGETTPANTEATDVDTINGGDDVDTVSYEGEAATFDDQANNVAVRDLSVNLADTVVPAVEDNPATPTNEAVPAHITATLGTIADRIVVENKGTKEEPMWVSTIENVIGGGGADTITGDARDNELTGGPGADVIAGGKGNDIVNADDADTDLDGGTGLLAEDDEDTADVDESTAGDMDVLSYAGVTEDTDTTNNTPTPTPDGVEVTISNDDAGSGIRGFEQVIGSPLNDTFTAPAEGGVTIMGGGGADTINGAAGKDTLMGGAGADDINGGAEADVLNGGPGEDTLTGQDGGDVFVLFAGEGPDTIDDYMPDEADEEIHLKNFPSGTTAVVALSDTSTAVIMVGDDVLFKFTAHGAVTLDQIVADLKKTGSIVFVQPN